MFRSSMFNIRNIKHLTYKSIYQTSSEFWLIPATLLFIFTALPLSLGSMLVTQGLISKGIFSASARFGPYPKMAIAGVLGFAIGKMSYMGECKKKFQKIGIAPFGPQQKRQCHHACKECKAKLGSNEREDSIPSAS